MVVAEERPRIALTQSFSKIFKDLGLSPRAVSTTFGCRVNVAICLQVSSWGGKKRRAAEVRRRTKCRRSEEGRVEMMGYLVESEIRFNLS